MYLCWHKLYISYVTCKHTTVTCYFIFHLRAHFLLERLKTTKIFTLMFVFIISGILHLFVYIQVSAFYHVASEWRTIFIFLIALICCKSVHFAIIFEIYFHEVKNSRIKVIDVTYCFFLTCTVNEMNEFTFNVNLSFVPLNIIFLFLLLLNTCNNFLLYLVCSSSNIRCMYRGVFNPSWGFFELLGFFLKS